MLHEIYQDILDMKGHKIVGQAFNGRECIEMFKSLSNPGEYPDIVIMDHRMPIKHGLDATKELLQLNPELKIIFVSADKTIEEASLKAGAIGFVKKPFNIPAFFETIEKVLKTV